MLVFPQTWGGGGGGGWFNSEQGIAVWPYGVYTDTTVYIVGNFQGVTIK